MYTICMVHYIKRHSHSIELKDSDQRITEIASTEIVSNMLPNWMAKTAYGVSQLANLN